MKRKWMERGMVVALACLSALWLIGCSASSSYTGIIDGTLQAIRTGNAKQLAGMFDMQSAEAYFDAALPNYSLSATEQKEVRENFEEDISGQEDFLKFYDDLIYEFDDGFTVTRGNLYIDDTTDLGDLALYQLLRKAENEEESIGMTEFLNDFVDELSAIKIVETQMTIKSKDGATRDRYDLRFILYQRGTTWYLYSVDLYPINSIGLLEVVYDTLQERNTGDDVDDV